MAEWDLTPRKARDSEVELAQLMTIVDANNVGNVHGGTIMKLVDTAAGLAAARHCASAQMNLPANFTIQMMILLSRRAMPSWLSS